MALPNADRENATRLLRSLAPWLAALFLALPVCSSWVAETRALEKEARMGGRASVEAAFPLDDAYIYQVYGRHLAHGEGYAFNAGEPDSAATALLWALAVGALHAISPLDPLVSTQLFGVLLAYLACALAGCAVARFTASGLAGAVTSLALALTPRVTWGALAGMDPPLTLCLVAAGLAASARPRPGWMPLLFFGLAGFSRPEAFLALPLAALAALWTSWWVRRPPEEEADPVRRFAWRALLATAIATGAYALANFLLSGDPLPSTFRAKVGPAGLFDVVRGHAEFGVLWERVAELPWQVWFFLWQDRGLLLVPALAGLLFLGPSRRAPLRCWIPLLLFVYPLAKTLLAPSFNDLLFQHGRQGALLSLVGAAGIGGLVARILRSVHPLRATALAVLLPLLSAIWWFFPPVPSGASEETTQAVRDAVLREIVDFERWGGGIAPWVLLGLLAVGACAALRAAGRLIAIGIPLALFLFLGFGRAALDTGDHAAARADDVQRIVQMHVETGRWLAANTAPDDVIGANDIGAIGYYSDRRIVDLFGLIDPRILDFRRHVGGGLGATHAERSDLASEFLAVEELRCDYLALFPEWFPGLLSELGTAGPGQVRLDGPVLHQAQLPANPSTGSTLKIVVRLRHPE